MRTVYFGTSLFIEMANKKSAIAKDLKALLKELAEEKVRIYTSIITVQEMSVAVYRRGAKSKRHLWRHPFASPHLRGN